MKYDDEHYYNITLISSQLSTVFPNGVNYKSDKSTLLKNNILITLTFTEGACEDKNINVNLQLNLPNKLIKLIVDKGTGRCKIFLKQGYKIYFTHNDLFRNIIGFDEVVLNQAINEYHKYVI